jgi:predicted CXXCH cytochrome family protein
MNANWSLALAALAFALPVLAADSCLKCHANLDGDLKAPADKFGADIHAQFGLGCADCHGGDRNSDDYEVSMSPRKGFKGHIARTAVPKLCANCHSDPNFMLKYKPQQRVDQYAEYQTSVHGKRLAAGDEAVATCIDCHSVHEIRAVKDPQAPVYPLRLPDTCGKCHASQEHMAKYKIETNQIAEYRTSVHWNALVKGDLSAPTCASCHGNHGARPPQVASIANVCGTCHVLFADLYEKSPHQPVFSAMDAGGCVVCHSNHGIKAPSVAMIKGPNAVCLQCHDAGSPGGQAATQIADMLNQLSAALDRSDQILARARQSGMEVSEAQLRQAEGRDDLVKAVVAVHAFDPAAVRAPTQAGLAIAAGAYQSGASALKERDTRRMGLAISLITILITIAGLWLAIRNLESGRAKTIASGEL